MSKSNQLFTSESVSEGHPDKVCDQVSDSILDALLKEDPYSRVACETMAKNGVIILGGEITSSAEIAYEDIAREAIRKIGYTDPKIGFDSETCEILRFVNAQSPDISMGVNEGEGAHKEQGAGDQGLMFGFACNETEDLMPLPIYLSHNLARTLSQVRHNNEVDFLRPDSKTQVTVRYEDGKPAEVTTIVVSTQHTDEATDNEIEEVVMDRVIKKVVPENMLTANTRYYINPTGRFVIGGPVGDCGLTGRKIIVDTYGGYSRHGGGAFSGKDATKVDRSAAYAARHIAKNVVAAGLADRCEVQLAYAIGVAEPVSIMIDTFGTGKVPEAAIEKAVSELFSLTPAGIMDSLELRKPIFAETAAYGHFGRKPTDDGHFSWERTDKAAELQSALS